MGMWSRKPTGWYSYARTRAVGVPVKERQMMALWYVRFLRMQKHLADYLNTAPIEYGHDDPVALVQQAVFR